jgi:hypothetical protein
VDLRRTPSYKIKMRLAQLSAQEVQVPDRRHVFRPEIDELRAELVERLRADGGPGGTDLTGDREPRPPRPQRGSDGIALAQPLSEA